MLACRPLQAVLLQLPRQPLSAAPRAPARFLQALPTAPSTSAPGASALSLHVAATEHASEWAGRWYRPDIAVLRGLATEPEPREVLALPVPPVPPASISTPLRAVEPYWERARQYAEQEYLAERDVTVRGVCPCAFPVAYGAQATCSLPRHM